MKEQLEAIERTIGQLQVEYFGQMQRLVNQRELVMAQMKEARLVELERAAQPKSAEEK